MRLTCTVTRSRGLAVAVVAGLALGTALAGPAVAASAEPSANTSPECVTAVSDEAEAVRTAVACGSTVEVLSARTEWDTLYAQADGTMRWDSSAVAVRTDVTGEWTDVDPTVVLTGAGLEVAAPVVPMTFSDGTAGQPLVRMERDGHELTFDVPLDLTSPSVDGSRITYPEVLPGVDLVVTVDADATGFSEVLRIESPEAAANPALAELTFPVEVSDGLDVAEHEGGFVVTDADGASVFTSPTPTMWDSDEGPGAPPTLFASRLGAFTARGAEDGSGGEVVDPAVAPADGATVVPLPATVGADEVTLTPDAALLTDPSTVWPVYVDPAISGSRNQWTAVRDTVGPKYAFDPDEGVGLCNRATSTTCSTTFRSRLLWQFTGLAAIGAMGSSEIISATFSAVGTHSYDCTPRPVTLYWTADFSASTPWPGGGLWNPLSTQTVAHKASCAGQPVRWIEFDATGAARAVADYDADHVSVGLVADESSMLGWKRYRNDAMFSVTFNRAPAPAAGLRVTSGSVTTACSAAPVWINTATPTLRGTISDPDGGNVYGRWEIRAANNAVIWATGLTTALASGSEHSIGVPAGVLADGGSYTWTVQGVDPSSVWGQPGTYCPISVDLTPPVAPTVVPSTDVTPTGTLFPTTPLAPVSRFMSILGRGDFDGDGHTDVLGLQKDGILRMFRTTGSGGWQSGEGTVIGTGWAGFKKVLAPGDFDGDGFADLIAEEYDGRLYMYRGNGAGGWATGSGQLIGTGWTMFSDVIAPGDFDGDGHVDLLGMTSTGVLHLYPGDGAGGWLPTAGTVIGTGWTMFTSILTPGDVDGDGAADLIGVRSDGSLLLYRGNGAGGWGPDLGQVVGTGWTANAFIVAPGDFDGDGNVDLLGVRADGSMTLFRGNGSAAGTWFTDAVLYPASAWAGGIGRTGGFRLGNGGSTDVVSYKYSFNNTALSSSVAGTSAVVTFTPTTVGPQTLRVQSVDRAGNVSPVTAYTFNVAIPSASALWSLDEGSGGTAVDSGPAGNRFPLTLTGTPAWGNGPLAELADDPSDRALVLDSADDGAVTSSPVLATHGSFTVGATVRLDATPTGGVATVISQDGTAVSGFELGYRADGACSNGSTECWYFAMSSADAAGKQVRVTSDVDLGTGHWVYLAGVHNADTDTVQLSVCSLEGGLVPQASGPVPFASTWEATGPLRLGQGRAAGASAWQGSIADAQVLDGAASEGQIYRACNRVFSPTVDQ